MWHLVFVTDEENQSESYQMMSDETLHNRFVCAGDYWQRRGGRHIMLQVLGSSENIAKVARALHKKVQEG